MGITEIVLKSLEESVQPKRFLPFFLLYFLFSLCILIFSIPALQVLPSIILLEFTMTDLTIVAVNVLALLVVFLIVCLVNLWFTGALIFDVHKNKGFDKSLKHAKSLFSQMALLSLIIFLFAIVSNLFREFGIIVKIVIDWVFMFSLVSIIVKKDKFDTALTRSYNIVKKDLVKTIAFLVITYFISIAIFLFAVFAIAFAMAPLSLTLMEIMPISGQLQVIPKQRLVQIIALIFRSYPAFILISIIASLFFSIAYVFIHISRTNYFLQKKKR